MSSTGDPSRRRDSHATEPHAVSPEATYVAVDRLVTLVQEIGNLLDGSLHSLSLAAKNLAANAAFLSNAAGSDIQRQLGDAAGKLERISELVHAAMQGKNVPLGSPLLAKARPIMLKEAVEHAADVLRPMITRCGVDLKLQMPDYVASTPAGALYTVVLNGLQNSIESIQRRGGIGRVTVTVRREQPPRTGGYGRDVREWLTIEIIDDGEGPPAAADTSRVFDLGFSTKPRGTGVGLAVARSVVQSMGGTIELFPNLDKAPIGKRGAVLRARFPSPDIAMNLRLGGAA